MIWAIIIIGVTVLITFTICVFKSYSKRENTFQKTNKENKK